MFLFMLAVVYPHYQYLLFRLGWQDNFLLKDPTRDCESSTKQYNALPSLWFFMLINMLMFIFNEIQRLCKSRTTPNFLLWTFFTITASPNTVITLAIPSVTADNSILPTIIIFKAINKLMSTSTVSFETSSLKDHHGSTDSSQNYCLHQLQVIKYSKHQ